MKTKVLIVLGFLSVVVFLGCEMRDRLNYPTVVEDVAMLSTHSNDVKNPWQVIDYLPLISFDTLIFLSDNLKYCNDPKTEYGATCKMARDLNLSVRGLYVQWANAPVPDMKVSEYYNGIEDVLKKGWAYTTHQNAVSSRAVRARGEQVDVTYCVDDSHCIAASLGTFLHHNQFVISNGMVLVGLVPNGKPVRYDNPRIERSESKTHVALFVQLRDMGWGVVDPLMFDDAKAHSVKEWGSHIKNLPELRVEATPYRGL